jgi:hypothetical protein
MEFYSADIEMLISGWPILYYSFSHLQLDNAHLSKINQLL